MKNTLIFLLALCGTFDVHAQYSGSGIPPIYPIVNVSGATLDQVIDTMYAHANPTDTVEGGELDQIAMFKMLWQGRVTKNTDTAENMFQHHYRALRTATAARAAGGCGSSGGFSGNWQVGPDSLSVQVSGYTNAIWVDTASDSNYMLAGSVNSGMFKTLDGGKNWACITDNCPAVTNQTGVVNISVNRLNINTIYAGLLAGGLIKSFDRGTTWQQEVIPLGGGSPSSADSAESVAVVLTEDSARLYALTGTHVFTRPTSGSTWTDITPPLSLLGTVVGWTDITFVPAHPGHFFVAGQYAHIYRGLHGTDSPSLDNTAVVYESKVAVPGPSDWTDILASLVDSVEYGSSFLGYHFMQIRDTDLTFFKLSADAHNLYAICIPLEPTIGSSSAFGAYSYPGGLYKYSYSSGSPAWISITHELPGANTAKFTIAVSPNDSNVFYYGTLEPYLYFPGSTHFYPIGRYSADPTHGDIRDIYIQYGGTGDTGKTDRVYFATDGGISAKYSGVDMYRTGYLSTKDISGHGLATGDYFSFSTGEKDALGVGGMLHDGIVGYDPQAGPKWVSLEASDAWGCAVDKSDPDRAYGWLWYNELTQTEPAGGREMGSLTDIAQPDMTVDPGFGGVGKQIETDNYGTIYSVGSDFWRKRQSDTAFVNTHTIGLSGWGFPDRIIGDTFYGAVITLNPADTTFEGYVLYNTSNADTQHIYYRSGSLSAGEILTPIPGQYTYPIVCIATDPGNTEHVWVCQGGTCDSAYSDGTRNRVQYSPDHGTTWIDISSGLPQGLPAMRIAYDDAAGVLYCSDDAGMYRYDCNQFNSSATYTNSQGNYENSSVSWVCFNTGAPGGHDFPYAAASDLRINHCQGKIYAATFGRSVWYSDLYEPNTVINNTNVITTSQTWSGKNQYITGSIDIQAGATLTITGDDTVHMPKNGSINVEPGGHLIVSNSEITNSCVSCLWHGIQAWGNVGSPQTPTSNQGWVTIENGSTIANAQMAVENRNDTVDWGADGGIIQCSNSYFYNNYNSASFFAYDNYTGSGSSFRYTNNLSYFTNCTFLLDNNYKGDAMDLPMKSMVSLNNVEGLKFKGCQWINRDMNSLDHNIGNGIYAVDAGFDVETYCPTTTGLCTSPVRSRFVGLAHGVDVQSIVWPVPLVNVGAADFDTVSIGVFLSAAINASVYGCNFTIGHGAPVSDSLGLSLPGCAQNIGIFVQNSPQFHVSGNTFLGKANATTDWENFGTVTTNTGGNANEITGNAFDTLDAAVYAEGNNRQNYTAHGPVISVGLQLLCNSFAGNATDIAVYGDGGTTAQGIGGTQGTAGAAGNTFTGSTTNINNAIASYTMQYNYYTSGTGEDPTVTTGSGAVLTVAYPTANACSAGFGGSGGAGFPGGVSAGGAADQSVLRTYKGAFYSGKATVTDSTAVYNSRIDFGNTDSLVSIINASQNPTLLGAILKTGSPYISATALEAAGSAAALSKNAMLDIVARNPDNLRDNVFVTAMQTDYSLSGGEMGTMQAETDSVTPRTLLLGAITTAQAAMDYDGFIILRALESANDTSVSVTDTTGAGICTDSTSVYYMLDSNSYYVGLDSVDTWLQNIGTLWAQYARVGYYNFAGNLTVADSIFQSINSLIPALQAGQTADPTNDRGTYTTYTTVWDVIKGAENDGRNIYDLNSTDIASLDTTSAPVITYNTGLLVTGSLTGLMEGHTIPNPCIPFPAGAGRHSQNDAPTPPPITDNNSSNANSRFSVHPNPSSGTVTFGYNVQDGDNDVRITVTNIVGETVLERHTGNSAGSMAWDPESLPAGIYVYRASDGKGVISIGKIVLVR